MAKQTSVLDEAIEENPASSGRKIERLLAQLQDHESLDRLLDMLQDASTWGHVQMAGIIRHLCDHYNIDHDELSERAIRNWRSRQGVR